jgi:hypothetical protein
MPRGAEILTAGPEGLLAFYSAPLRRVVMLQDLELHSSFSVHGATDMVFTPSGELLILEDPTRSLSLWSQSGDLLSAVDIPPLVPLGGRLELKDSQIRVRDLFGGLHRTASLSGHRLGAPVGELLIPVDSGLLWDRQERILWVDGQAWTLPEATQASAQRVGERWILIDEVWSDSPLEVRRIAYDQKTGATVDLPVSERLYTPRRDVAASEDGRLFFLWPREEGLEIVEVEP